MLHWLTCQSTASRLSTEETWGWWLNDWRLIYRTPVQYQGLTSGKHVTSIRPAAAWMNTIDFPKSQGSRVYPHILSTFSTNRRWKTESVNTILAISLCFVITSSSSINIIFVIHILIQASVFNPDWVETEKNGWEWRKWCKCIFLMTRKFLRLWHWQWDRQTERERERERERESSKPQADICLLPDDA